MTESDLVLIDGSYFCFYRYHATVQWWGLARPGIKLGVPSENAEFVERFRSTFVTSLQAFLKKEKLTKATLWVGKDYPNVWRNGVICAYKGNRDNSKHKDIGFFLGLAYDSLFVAAGVSKVLGMPELEADDCIAITVTELCKCNNRPRVLIITSDHDYLQLNRPGVSLVNLKHQRLNESKKSHNDAELDLFCKILCGDKSDNIPGVVAGVGPKTAVKLFRDPNRLTALLSKHPGAQERFDMNSTLIDFSNIPECLAEKFRTTVLAPALHDLPQALTCAIRGTSSHVPWRILE